MESNQQQDTGDGSQESLEQRVDEFMKPVDSTAPEPKKPNKVTVKFSDEEETSPSSAAPTPKAPKTPAKKTAIAITIAEDSPAVEAPKQPPKKRAIVVTEAPQPDPAPELDAEAPEPTPADAGSVETVKDPAEPVEVGPEAIPAESAQTAPLVAPKELDATPPEAEAAPGASEEQADDTNDTTPTTDEVDDTAATTLETPTESSSPAEDLPETDTERSFEAPETVAAIDDIITTESDELLAAQDAPVRRPVAKTPRRSFREVIADWWANKTLRWVILGGVATLLIALGAYPTTRYLVLNAVGVRGSASVQVIDGSTFQPLKSVTVSLAGKSAQTDQDGRASFTKVPLGSTELVIEKRAFAPIHNPVVLGWGSNPLGGFNVTPVGTQYNITILDYVSKKPLAKVQATSEDANSQSDDKGNIQLTIDHGRAVAAITVKLSAPGYRDEQVVVGDSTKHPSVSMVPANKNVFISKRTGKYDVYAIYVDGSDEKLLLAGTGNEQDAMSLIPSRDGQSAAFVSTRDQVRNDQGFLESTLTVLNLGDASSKTVTHSEQIEPVGWSGGRFVYVQVAAGTSAGNPGRVKLMSYDSDSGDNHQLATANYFNDIMMIGDAIYYAPSSTYQAAGVAINLFSIRADGSNKQTVLGQEVWNLFRTSYDDINISVTSQQWYDLKLGSAPSKLAGAPGNLKSRVYTDSPDGKHSLWVDMRDGKGVLLDYDTTTKADLTLLSKSGLSLPVRWLNDTTLVYRVNDGQESADYALSLSGGEPHKIVDVTNTSGIDRWYYY